MIIDGSKQFSNYFQINIIFHDDRRYFKEMKFHSRKGGEKIQYHYCTRVI